MKKIFLILTILVSSMFGACASKPSKASDLYNGCIFVVKNGEITSYGVYVEVKDGRVSVEPYEYYDRQCMITISDDDFSKLTRGRLDPVKSIGSGYSSGFVYGPS